jgi:hypothetical protein
LYFLTAAGFSLFLFWHLRVATSSSVARITPTGVDMLNVVGRMHLSWAEIQRIKIVGDGRREQIHFIAANQKPWWKRVDGIVLGKMNKSPDEILSAVAYYRPDLLPNVTPINPEVGKNARSKSKPIPQQVLTVVDSRSWTG